MKQQLILLLLGVFATSVFSQTKEVTLEEALEITSGQFVNQDVDIFLVQQNNKNIWQFFIDAQPNMGWSHECYLLSIPKQLLGPLTGINPKKIRGKMPPAEPLIPLLEKNRYEPQSYNVTRKVWEYNPNINDEVARKTYAVILNGGFNINSNHPRYWYDCAEIFNTLKYSYGIPQSNISVIFADGTDPGDDTYMPGHLYGSSYLDFDMDGIDDIQYAATKNNVKSVLQNLRFKLKRDDHLLFFVTDHGDSLDGISQSYIYLWGDEILHDTELANYLAPLMDKGITVNVVLGQCYSGGFIDDLAKIGCVVSTACTGSEPSWTTKNQLFDEFLHHWTCALKGEDFRGNTINADYNGDGHISMSEAFLYAKNNDTQDESPQFYGGNDSEGNFLSFTDLPLSTDIYIKDNDEDIGDEPNLTTDIFWDSPSICVRNEMDGIFQHENPIFALNHQMAFMYVRVYNKGKKTFRGNLNNEILYGYWGKASTGLTPQVWRGRELEGDYPTGGPTETVAIKDTIFPGQSADKRLRWILPYELYDAPFGQHHYCLYAKILDKPTDEPIEVTKFNSKGSKREAQKNVTIIKKEYFNEDFNVYVRNVLDAEEAYTLEFKPRTDSDASFFTDQTVTMEMTPLVYEAWERGGCIGEDIQPIVQNNQSTRNVRLLSKNSKVKQIKLHPKEFDRIKLKFRVVRYNYFDKKYTFDLIQRDANGNIIGGETFIIERPTFTLKPIVIVPSDNDNGTIRLKAEGNDFVNYNWLDENDNIVGEAKEIDVLSSSGNTEYRVVANTENGEYAMASINLNAPQEILQTIAHNGDISVSLKLPATENTSIEISSINPSSNFIRENISSGETCCSIDASELGSGIYIIKLIVESQIIDTKKIFINN